MMICLKNQQIEEDLPRTALSSLTGSTCFLYAKIFDFLVSTENAAAAAAGGALKLN